MIIMINGAFGAGKTSAAYMLHQMLDNSLVFDPEEIGDMLRKIVPEHIRDEKERTDDFQDMELWRILTVDTARELIGKYNKDLIIPMTIYKTDNFEYILNGLKSIDPALHHFCLLASESTIKQRLQKRGDALDGWTYQQTLKCTQALTDSRFEQFIETDNISIDDVVNTITEKLAIYQDCTQ
ncbi:AAA family ATPase [Paenibacillus septentrionalis]|uniref:AAA family ATPase n=1 Tax=Paenibacillus septentrionalis TaxID=429342 RepID=A0ABW1V4V2_9BACL